MKKLFTLLFSLLSVMVIFAQTPQFVNYQAVIWDSEGKPKTNANATVEISILNHSATSVYREQHNVTTNDKGLFALKIGQGSPLLGTFSAINWGADTYSLSVSIDGVSSGAGQMASVPYALHAKEAENVPDVSTLIKNPTTKSSGDFLTYDGTNWVSKKISTGITGSGLPVSNLQPYLALNYCIALQGVFPSRNMNDTPYLASIGIFAGNFEPRGWAFCNGQILSIAQNTALFSLLGTIYGGNGQTTFALPDLRGRVVVGAGQGPGLSPYSLGQSSGAESIYLTISNLPQHTHTINILP